MTLLIVLELTLLVAILLHLFNAHVLISPTTKQSVSFLVSAVLILVVIVWVAITAVARFT